MAGLFARRGFNIQSLAVGVSEDPLTTDVGITSQDIIANGAATTAYQQAIATITAPPNAKWMRIVAYHNSDAVGGVTVWWDRMGIVPMGPQISANVNQLPLLVNFRNQPSK